MYDQAAITRRQQAEDDEREIAAAVACWACGHAGQKYVLVPDDSGELMGATRCPLCGYTEVF